MGEGGLGEDDRKQDEQQMFADLSLVAPRPDRQETYGGEISPRDVADICDLPLCAGDVRKEPPRFVPRLCFFAALTQTSSCSLLSKRAGVNRMRPRMDYETVRRLLLTRYIDQH